jgi:dTDP-4-dehydrorhamnose reductase
MKVLITGANGQLGSEIRELVTMYENLDAAFTDFDTLDITNQEAVFNFIGQWNPEYIINCAAYTAVDKAENEISKAYQLNAIGPENLANACARSGARLIHISTDYVFDGMAYQPYTEDVKPNPQSIYGKSKLKGEENVVTSCPSALIIRTSWLYSSYGNNFVKTMIRLGTERDLLKVVFDQVGTPTYARDLASVIIGIIKNSAMDDTLWNPGIYHYSNEGVCSWYDFAIGIHHLAGLSCHTAPIESKDFPTLAKRPFYSVLNKTKIKSAFGIKIPYWRQSLHECIKIIINS